MGLLSAESASASTLIASLRMGGVHGGALEVEEVFARPASCTDILRITEGSALSLQSSWLAAASMSIVLEGGTRLLTYTEGTKLRLGVVSDSGIAVLFLRKKSDLMSKTFCAV